MEDTENFYMEELEETEEDDFTVQPSDNRLVIVIGSILAIVGSILKIIHHV